MAQSAFSQLKKKKEEGSIEGGESSSKPRFTKDEIRTWMNVSQQPKKSSICAILVGSPKSGKTGVALDCRNEQEKEEHKKIIVFELNSDQGCDINRKEHHNDDADIIILNPREYSVDKSGKLMPDYIATMEKIKFTIETIKEDYDKGEIDLKAIVFDGLDIFLGEICESQMRIDEHIDAAGGVSMRFWKNRNKFYYDVINMIFDIDVDKYFITHFGDRRRDEKTGQFNDERTVARINPDLVYSCQKSTADKMHQIIEFDDETTIKGGIPDIKLTATIVSDRRNLKRHMEKVVIAELDDEGEVIWKGTNLLR